MEVRKATLQAHNALHLPCIFRFPPHLTCAVAWMGKETPAATRKAL